MASKQATPLDELSYNRRDVIQWWVNNGGKPMDENMIYRYLNEAPFYDQTSNNAVHFAHAERNGDPRAAQFVSDRRLFEGTLRQQVGTEYMIVDEPKPAKDAKDALPAETTGIWVVRKQDRQKVQGYDGRLAEQLTPLETFYSVGENMFKAASVADTIGNRLLVAQRHIQAFVDAANELPSFDPAMGGHYYLRPQNKPAAATGVTSGPTSPGMSREGSVADAHSVRSGSVDLNNNQAGGGDPSASALEDRLLRESLGMSVQFGDEYMDENPIIGEPGKFSFTSSTAAVKKRKADEEAAATKAKLEKEAKSASAASTPKVAKAPAPLSIMTEAKVTKKGTGKMGEKIKRKKSKGNALSPTTPGGGASSSSI